jgi:hypothetical protein
MVQIVYRWAVSSSLRLVTAGDGRARARHGRRPPRAQVRYQYSVANSALATRTGIGAQRERCHAGQAAKPDGRATVSNSHRAVP